MTARTRRLTTRAALTPFPDPLTSTAWRDQAECRTVDPELFFPHSTTTAEGRRQTETAKRVCQNCLVRQECLAWALETRQDTGVWVGASEDERRAMHRRLPLYQKARKTKAVDHILSEQRAEFLELAKEADSVELKLTVPESHQASTVAALGMDPLHWLLTGGEYHALAATFPTDAALPEGWTVIGNVEAGDPEVLVDGRPYAGGPSGWDHFRAG